jgi:hypothetical protein
MAIYETQKRCGLNPKPLTLNPKPYYFSWRRTLISKGWASHTINQNNTVFLIASPTYKYRLVGKLGYSYYCFLQRNQALAITKMRPNKQMSSRLVERLSRRGLGSYLRIALATPWANVDEALAEVESTRCPWRPFGLS